MKTQNAATQNKNHNLSSVQLRTFSKFQRKLKEKVPDYQIVRVHPIKENMIEVGLDTRSHALCALRPACLPQKGPSR